MTQYPLDESPGKSEAERYLESLPNGIVLDKVVSKIDDVEIPSPDIASDNSAQGSN